VRSRTASHLRSNLVAYIALFCALGGTSYAATQLPPNSVGNRQLQKNAVTASKVKAGSLLARDFKHGQLPRGAAGSQGPQGAPGLQGAPGSPGTARAYALVNSDGTFVSGVPHPGFTAVSSSGSAGFFCLTAVAGITPAQYPAVASANYYNSPDLYVSAAYRDRSDGTGVCSGNEYEVVTYNLTTSPPQFANESFSIIIP